MLEKVQQIYRETTSVDSVNLQLFHKSGYGSGIILTVEFYDGEVYEGEGDDIDKVIKDFEEWLEEEYNVPEQG